jgi:nucleotide-binding universal stress UspA family protein
MRDLERLAASMHVHGTIQIQPLVQFGDPAEVILDVARVRRHDQIVMGTHSQSARTDLRLGSVADRVARGAPCPVVTVSGNQARTELRRVSLATRSEPAEQGALVWID